MGKGICSKAARKGAKISTYHVHAIVRIMGFQAVAKYALPVDHIPTGPTVCASVVGALAGVPWIYGQRTGNRPIVQFAWHHAMAEA